MKNIIPLLGFIFMSISPFSQPVCIERIGEDKIVSITEDADYVYLATRGNGLAKMDKQDNSLSYWNTSNSNISSDNIKSILNYNDEIYISTDSVLLKLVSDNFQMISDTINGILIENLSGDLVVGGNLDIHVLNPDMSLEYYVFLDDVLPNQCCSEMTDIDIDDDGNIWFSHYDFYEYEVLKFDGTDWTIYEYPDDGLPIESFYEFNGITNIENAILVSNWGGVQEYTGTSWTPFHTFENPTIVNSVDTLGIDHPVSAIEYDSEGWLWAASGSNAEIANGKIVFRIDDGSSWQFLISDEGFYRGLVFYESPSLSYSKMYLGTEKGLVVIDKDCLLTIDSNEDLQDIYSIHVSPNPFVNEINIRLEGMDNFDFEIMDAKGSIIKKGNASNDSNLNLMDLSNGIYFLSIYTEKGIYTHKIMK